LLQTDEYAAYRSLADPKRAGGPVKLAFCWAHCRRQFFDIAKTAPAPIATEALKRIAELYEVEAEIRGKSANERRAVRQQKTKPLLEALKTWLEKTLAQVPCRSTIAKAIRYALNQWHGLVRFLDDGRIEIDSNTVERAMRPIALTRKNALFAGSDEGAENWAMLASLIETCKLHGVNPEAYLTDVLSKLVNNWPTASLSNSRPGSGPPTLADRQAPGRKGIKTPLTGICTG
jgi:transposase